MPLPFPAAMVADALIEKGMEPHPNHHWMYRRKVDGVMTLVTRISHGATEIGKENAGKMAKQCSLLLNEFVRLVECTLTAEEWEGLVRERCVGGRNPFIGQ